MIDTSLDELLNDLLKLSLSLEKLVSEEERDPEEWIELLEQRQVIIDKLTKLFDDGITLSEAQKQTIMRPAFETDNKVIAMMSREKAKLAFQIADLQKSKTVNEQYGGYSGASLYGAFIDKKK